MDDLLSRILFLFFCLFLSQGQSQTATLSVDRTFYDNSFADFDAIIFTFNEVSFYACDTTSRVISLRKDFDQCQAIIGKDTLDFFAKFKVNEEYVIRPGCCCTAFTLQAKNNSRRGEVIFENQQKRDLGLIVAEANWDTVRAQKTKAIFAYESAMCLFKPASIQIVETDYFDAQYDYKNDTRDYEKIWKEQASLILAKTWFHFLHGEQVLVRFDEFSNKLVLNLQGYLSEEAYRNKGF